MQSYSTQQSPFAHFFGTNDVPSESEATRICQMISKPVEELCRLNEEIAGLLSRLDGLRVKRDEVQAYVDAHRVLLAPVRRLPPDIFGEIFVHCLSTDRNPTRSLAEAPLLLGLICRSWRDISLSTPQLWTGIHVNIPYARTWKHQSLSDLVEVRTQGMRRWLGRSGTLPLSISLRIDYDIQSNPISALEEFARTLMQLSARWSCLDLRVPYAFLEILHWSLEPDDLPLLRDFRADLDNSFPLDVDASAPETLLEAFLAAPTLNNVAIIHNQLSAHRALALPPLTLASLTSLSVQSPMHLAFTVDEVLAILMQCKLLRYLTLPTEVVHATRADDVPARIDLPNLVDLRLRMNHAHDDLIAYAPSGSYHAFFSRLYTPSLKSLVLSTLRWSGDGSNGVGNHLSFLPLLSGYESPLESLHINFPCSAKALSECLRLVPRLTSLHTNLLGTETVNGFSAHFHALIPTDSSPIPLCSSLEDVHLHFKTETPGPSDEILLAFAQSRWRPAHPGISKLNQFHAVFARRMITDIRPQVRVLQDEGMDLVITHMPEFDPVDEGASSSRYFEPWF